MKDEKREILDWLQLVTERTNIRGVFRDLGIDSAGFYTGRYSLDRMKEVKEEMQERLKALSKM